MRVVIVARDGADYSRTVDEWVHEFERRTGCEVERLDPDTRDGERFCRTYDVVEYPSIVVSSGDGGAMQAMWSGKTLPLFDDVAYWAIK